MRDAFRGVRLTAPLKKSLVGKRKALDKALDAYKQAAEYNVAEVTTAATYEMAELYRTLAKDLLASERPKTLKGDALEQYNLLLEEQVFPFEEQAIQIHELNAARAKEGVYDDRCAQELSGAGGAEARALRQDGADAGCRRPTTQLKNRLRDLLSAAALPRQRGCGRLLRRVATPGRAAARCCCC